MTVLGLLGSFRCHELAVMWVNLHFKLFCALSVSCLSGEHELGFCKKEKNFGVSIGLYLTSILSVSSLSYCKDLKYGMVSHAVCFLLHFCF